MVLQIIPIKGRAFSESLSLINYVSNSSDASKHFLWDMVGGKYSLVFSRLAKHGYSIIWRAKECLLTWVALLYDNCCIGLFSFFYIYILPSLFVCFIFAVFIHCIYTFYSIYCEYYWSSIGDAGYILRCLYFTEL